MWERSMEMRMKEQGFEIPVVSMRPPKFKVDNSCTLSFDTGELSTEQNMNLFENKGRLGTLLFIPEGITQPPVIDSSFEGKKPSERLRNVIFVYWKQQGSKGSFDQYYVAYIEKIIESIKAKLDTDI